MTAARGVTAPPAGETRTDVAVHRHHVVGRDGTRLALDTYLPAARHPVPVVVTRTPYGRAGHLDEGLGWARSGVAFVAQDVRGRYDSDGTWQPYAHERADGADLLAWLHAQPWCDGRVVATGASYAAGTAWALAVEAQAGGRPLRGVVSMVPALGLGRVKFDPSGVLRLAEHVQWWVEHAEARVSRPGLARRLAAADPDLLGHLPVVGLGERLWPGLPGWADVVRRGPHGHVEVARPHELAALTLPSLHVGGWRDLLVGETLRQHATVGSAAAVRGARALVVGPWGHDLGGPDARVGTQPLGARVQRWVRAALGAGADASGPDVPGQDVSGPDDATHVADATTGRPLDLPAWPPSVTWQRLALDDDAEPGARVTWVHDPADPHPTRPLHVPHRAPVRPDAALHRGAPLPHDLTLAGTPTAHLRVATDVDADWVVRLGTLAPDGTRTPLAQGVAAARPGGALDLELSATAATVPAGHRLEVEVCGADAPALARHLGAGHDRYLAARYARTTQHLDPHGSWLGLPVLGAADGTADDQTEEDR